MRDVLCRIDRQGLAHALFRAGASKGNGLRIERAGRLIVKEPDQQICGLNRGADKLHLLDRIEQNIGAIPVFSRFARNDVGGSQKPILARARIAGNRR